MTVGFTRTINYDWIGRRYLEMSLTNKQPHNCLMNYTQTSETSILVLTDNVKQTSKTIRFSMQIFLVHLHNITHYAHLENYVDMFYNINKALLSSVRLLRITSTYLKGDKPEREYHARISQSLPLYLLRM